jgi:hypothetical protein
MKNSTFPPGWAAWILLALAIIPLGCLTGNGAGIQGKNMPEKTTPNTEELGPLFAGLERAAPLKPYGSRNPLMTQGFGGTPLFWSMTAGPMFI